MQIESLSIEDLAAHRDRVITARSDKVAARQKELLAESERVGALVTSKPSTARPKRPVKYRDGENTWSGVGTMPAGRKPRVMHWRPIGFEIWVPFLETYRTMCCAPGPDFQQILEDVRGLRFAA
jgi:hypothetical protein